MTTVAFDEKTLVEANVTPQEFEQDVRTGTALGLYLRHRLTLGQAAKLARMSQYEFMRFLGRYNIPCIDYPADDLEQEAQP